MSRKTCAFALMVLTLALAIVPGVYAEYPIDDLVVVQDLPENMVAGSTYEMVILFDNIAKEPVTFYVNITVTGDEPLGFGEILVDEVKLNEVDLACVETEPGIFSTPAGRILDAMSQYRLDITISTVANLMPGSYIFEIDLMGKKMEPKPGPPHIIGRPNASPKADAGPNQKAWVGNTVYFDGSKSEDPDGTIESYEWDFGDGEGASGVAVEHEYSESGQYTVTLNVRDDRWAYDSGTCKVKVSDPPMDLSAEFVVSDLIASTEVEEGEDVTFSVNVTNIGELEGRYTVEFKVDGVTIETEIVPLARGDSTTVSFEETWSAGTYQVNVEDLTGSFTVVPIPTVPIWMRPGTIAGILIVIVSAGAIIYTLRKRQVVMEDVRSW